MHEADAGFTVALCRGKEERTCRKRHSLELSAVRGTFPKPVWRPWHSMASLPVLSKELPVTPFWHPFIKKLQICTCRSRDSLKSQRRKCSGTSLNSDKENLMHTIQIMKDFNVRKERLTHARKDWQGMCHPESQLWDLWFLRAWWTISVHLRNPWASPTFSVCSTRISYFLSLQHSVLQTLWTTHMLPCPFFLDFQIILSLSLACSNQEPCTQGILGNVVSSFSSDL